MLDISHVTKIFGNTTAVASVSISIDRPMMIGIIGASGAGKSTLLRIVNRLENLTSGTVDFEGRQVSELRGKDKRQWQSDCAMIFQQFNLVPRMDVVSNVLHGTLNRRSTLATFFNIFPKSDIHKAIDILDRLGVAEHASKRAEALSGGQQQRLCIARAIAVNPEVILMDEPCSALDPIATARIEELIDELRENFTIGIVTHSMQQAARVSQRTAYFHMGSLVEVGSTDQIFTNPRHRLTEDYITGRFG